jgi:minor extracellular serine protease Vpr
MLIMLCTYSVQAQNMRNVEECCIKDSVVTTQTGMNGLVNLVLSEIQHKSKNSFLKNYYGIDPTNSQAEISGLLKIRPLANSKNTASMCTQFSEVASDLYTFQVKILDLETLASMVEVEYISLSRKAQLQLNNARHDAGVDLVHSGLNLPMPYTGKGILTGLVDVGIDYTHPAFKNENGDSSRIIKAWAQSLKGGQKPKNFNYGRELISEQEMLTVGYDSIPEHSHGTIVLASMAAGGYGSNGKLRGPAFNSKIIAVSSSQQESSILDGAKYFFKQASGLNKRGVFNISWGSQIGPHDGTSLFDQAIDSMTNAGNVIIGAVGNWQDDIIHLKHTSSTSSASTSVIAMQYDTANYSIIDFWGKANTSFQVQIKLVDKATGNISYSSKQYSTTQQGQNGFILPFGKDTSIFYIINATKDVYNKRPNSFVAIFHNHIKTQKNISITITTGTNNEVHGWCAQNATFSNKTGGGLVMANYVSGDNQSTIGELGGTSKTIITVGAHVSHRQYKSKFGDLIPFPSDSGNIANFSSLGPTLDGRTKPDITAPGSLIIPNNSFNFNPEGDEKNRIMDGSPFVSNGRSYYWKSDDATSFASPFVAGCVALILQADPTLNQKQIKDLVLKNTTVDQFTGTIPINGSNTWGFGKLNVYKAISSLLNITTSVDDKTLVNGGFWSTNPVSSSITVFAKSENTKSISLKVVDMLGNLVVPNSLPFISKEGSFYNFDTSVLKNGQYIGILSFDQENLKTFKITKID